MATSRVACSLPNGIELRFFKPFEDGTGFKQMVPTGESIILSGPSPRMAGVVDAVLNTVDAEQFQRWLDENPGHPFVISGNIRLLKDEGRPTAAAAD